MLIKQIQTTMEWAMPAITAASLLMLIKLMQTTTG